MTTPSYVSGTSTQPLLGETIGENLRRIVERFPDREALVVVHQKHRATYKQFWDETSKIARGLLVRGVKKGDRIGIWAPNRFEWVELQYATARMGAILVNINPAYRTHELEYALTHSGVSTLVHAKSFRQAGYGAMVREVRPRCPELKQTIVIDEDWADLKHDAIRLSDEALNDQERALQFDDPINIQYTSGTTGFPKGATLSHHNILNNGYFIGELLRYTEADRVCIPVPLYHCFGMVLGNLAITTHGAAMVFPGESFDPLGAMATVEAERCTSLYGVPTMFIAELDHPEFSRFDFSSLRTGIMAGSPCPIEVMKKVQKDMHMPEVTICYGMTETSPVSTQSKTDDPFEKRVATVGQVHPHVEIKIVDPTTGRVMPRATPGEICTRGYSVMLGYWNDPHATREAIDDGRWMHTGDLDRRAGREVRRGADGLGEAPPRRGAHGRGDPRLLQGQDRDLQDPALLQVRRLVPDDGHGEDPEVQDARGGDRGARPAEGRVDRDGVAVAPRPLSRAASGAARRSRAIAAWRSRPSGRRRDRGGTRRLSSGRRTHGGSRRAGAR